MLKLLNNIKVKYEINLLIYFNYLNSFILLNNIKVKY
jgi:hypothetical protein